MTAYPPSGTPPFPPHSTLAPQRPSQGLAITSLVLAFIPLLNLVGIILGIVALVKASKDPQRSGGKGLAIAGIIVGAVTFTGCAGIGILLPALGQARQAARQAVSKSHMQQIGVALSMYATDNKGKLPEAGADWQQRVASYVGGDSRVFSPPGSEAGQAGYIYVPGHDLSKDNPGSVLLFESPDLDFNRGRCCNVLFLDGHVESVLADRIATLLGPLKLPNGTPLLPPSRR